MLLNVRLILKENLNMRKMSAKVPASILKDEPELEKFEFPLIHSKEITKSHFIVKERVTSSEMWSPLQQKAGGQITLPVLNPRIQVPTPTPASQLLQGPASVSKHFPLGWLSIGSHPAEMSLRSPEPDQGAVLICFSSLPPSRWAGSSYI